MVPPLVPKQRRKVLSEEEYTETLSAIVQREYFPEIPELERQVAILERRSQGDFAGAVAVRRAARRLKEHEEFLADQQEQGEHDLVDNRNLRRTSRPLHFESLSGFHARVTSEDDQEFDSQQQQRIREHRERLDKLLRPSKQETQVLLLADSDMASDQFEATPNRITATEHVAPGVRNSLFFNPTPMRNGAGSSTATALMKRIADGKTITSASSSQMQLMPPPANVSKKVIPKHQLVEYIPKHAIEKRIESSQTRFPNQIIPFPSNAGRGFVPTTTRNGASSAWETETDGSVTDVSTDLDAPSLPIDLERHREQRRREGDRQNYVAMTPLIVPGTSGNESPIMTWGEVDGTPLIISGKTGDELIGSTIGVDPEYGLARESERERAAKRAADKLARRAKRAKMASGSSSVKSMPSLHRSTTPSLNPAALSLFQKTSQKASSRSNDTFASSLRSSYTPKVRSGSSVSSASRSHRSSKARTKRDSAFNTTPLVVTRK